VNRKPDLSELKGGGSPISSGCQWIKTAHTTIGVIDFLIVFFISVTHLNARELN